MATKIKLDHKGIRELLSSQDMMSCITRTANDEGKIVKKFICGDRVDVLVSKGGRGDADRTADN